MRSSVQRNKHAKPLVQLLIVGSALQFKYIPLVTRATFRNELVLQNGEYVEKYLRRHHAMMEDVCMIAR